MNMDPLPNVPGGFSTILADPPWRFSNRTGKVAPEHKRLGRYATMSLNEIKALPVADAAADNAHLYLWVPNALLPEGLEVMKAWGFGQNDGKTGPRRERCRFLFSQRYRATSFWRQGKDENPCSR